MKKKITFYENGNKCEETVNKNGKRDGEYISYFENGEKELVAFFKSGRPAGIWMCWDKEGDYDWVDMNNSK